MHVALDLGGVLPRGSTTTSTPLVWPVWFVADDHDIQVLMGALPAQPLVEAPRPRPAKEALRFQRDLAAHALPAPQARVGLAMFCTKGGAESPESLARYARLQGAAQLLALRTAAVGAGLDALLAPWGLDARPEVHAKVDHRLREGADVAAARSTSSSSASRAVSASR